MQSRILTRGVFLDFESVDEGDLDRSSLEASLSHWQWHKYSRPDQVPSRVSPAEVVISNKCVINRKTMERAGDLQLIAVAATGTNNIDLEAARELGITVCNIRDYATDSVAQHTITLMLNLFTGQPMYWNDVREGAWSQARQFCLKNRPIRQIRGLNFGVIGYGVLGRATAELATALGMNLMVAERKGEVARQGRVPFEQVVKQADVISVHCPLSDDTRSLIDARVMRAMKSDAVVINTARGGIVDEADLAEALRLGEIGGAAIDTLSKEPPPSDHVLLAADIPRLIVTPHNAWASRTARQAAIDQLADVISAFASGETINQV